MKKGLTRFADMTSEEFTTNAATYSTPLLSVSSKAELRAELPVDVRRGERAAASAKERYLASHAADGDGTSLSLKLATDAAAAAGERLPSERGGTRRGRRPRGGWDIRKRLPGVGVFEDDGRDE